MTVKEKQHKKLAFNLLLGLLQSEINLKESVNWNDVNVLLREPEDYVSFIDLSNVKYVDFNDIEIEIKLKDVLFLNKLISDLKYLINKPHNGYDIFDLSSYLKTYLDSLLGDDISITI
jgi:hypothetical protein